MPRPVPAADLTIMRHLDELHLEFPFAGSRILRDLLNPEGFEGVSAYAATDWVEYLDEPACPNRLVFVAC